MARKTKLEKQMERDVEEAFHKHGSGRQFDVFDLGKITAAGMEAGRANEGVEDAIKKACDEYAIKQQDTGK